MTDIFFLKTTLLNFIPNKTNDTLEKIYSNTFKLDTTLIDFDSIQESTHDFFDKCESRIKYKRNEFQQTIKEIDNLKILKELKTYIEKNKKRIEQSYYNELKSNGNNQHRIILSSVIFFNLNFFRNDINQAIYNLIKSDKYKIFKQSEDYDLVNAYLNSNTNICKSFQELSFLYRKLIEHNIINCNQSDFAKWLLKNNYIKQNLFDLFEERRNWSTLSKCTTINREDNFIEIFKNKNFRYFR